MSRPLPEGFLGVVHTLTIRQLAEKFQMGTKAVREIVADHGIERQALPSGKALAERPANFAAIQQGKSILELCSYYSRNKQTIRRWLAEIGVNRAEARRSYATKPTRAARHILPFVAPTTAPARDTTDAGRAATFLQHYGAVYRCNERGSPDVAGKRWRRGSAILTDAELIERAERLGWDANAWRRVA